MTVSIVDVANPCVFVRAEEFGLDDSELPDHFASSPALIERIRELRGKVAERIGLTMDWRDVDRQSPSLPLFVAVSAPRAYPTMQGETVDPARTDLHARRVWNYRCHESMAGTGSMCTAAASRVPGAVVNQVIEEQAAATGRLQIGQPMGVVSVEVEAEPANIEGSFTFNMLGFSRTARRIMDGFVYVPKARLMPVQSAT